MCSRLPRMSIVQPRHRPPGSKNRIPSNVSVQKTKHFGISIVLRSRQLPLDVPLKLEIQVPFNSTPTRASIRVSGIPGAVHKQVNAALLMIRQAKGSPFVFVQEFREFSMPDVFIRNLREVSESALD
jgi:hypothetical protein